MSSGKTTTDHNEIKKWVEARGGRPAVVAGTGGMLRIDFNEPDARLEPIDWDAFFRKFDESKLAFLYGPDKDSRFFKFIQQPGTSYTAGDHTPVAGHEQEAAAAGKKHREWEKAHPEEAKAYAAHERAVQQKEERQPHGKVEAKAAHTHGTQHTAEPKGAESHKSKGMQAHKAASKGSHRKT